MSSPLRKRTHSLTKDINSSSITTPRKKTKKSSATGTRSKDKQEDTSSVSKDTLNEIGINQKNISSNVDEVNGELTRDTSSLSIEDNHNSNNNNDNNDDIGSNTSSPLSSPSSSLNSEDDTGCDRKDDTIEPLLLPNVVWVNDGKKGWWPSEIISKDKSEKPLLVRLFGQKSPCTIELHTVSKSNILPFHNELFSQLRKTGENSNMKELFNKAIFEAMAKETEDDDGLPSKDWAIQMVVENSSLNNKKKKNEGMNLAKKEANAKRTKRTNNPSVIVKEGSSKEKSTEEVSNLSDFESEKDETLQIPGECVLASESKSKKIYYPAKIIGYSEPDKYHVLFCDNSKRTVKRKNFFTKYEDGFKTCKLGEFEREYEDPTYEDPELVKKIQSLEPTLSQILRGKDNSSWRFQHFYEGSKKRKLLASKVSPGPFSLSQFGLIAKVLRGMFIPEIAESIDKKGKILSPLKIANNGSRSNVKNSVGSVDDSEEKQIEKETAKSNENNNKSMNIDESITAQLQRSSFNFDLSTSDLKLRFVNDVLLPETIIRLIMNEEEIGYEEADRKMLYGYNEERWVEHLMAERTSFQVGSESLREKA